MIRAYFEICIPRGAFSPPTYKLCCHDFKSLKDFKKKGNVCLCYFGLEKYNQKGKFIKKIKKY